MGIQTSISAVALTNAEIAAGFVYTEDVVGMLASARTDAFELISKLKTIVAAIPAGANATALTAVVTALS